jgi:hypothetical protein
MSRITTTTTTTTTTIVTTTITTIITTTTTADRAPVEIPLGGAWCDHFYPG